MSKEIKMSDVFDGPVVNDADTLIAKGYGELADFSGYKKECRYVAHAINNHDTLTEQVKQLREALYQVVGLSEILIDNKYLKSIEVVSVLSPAKRLLETKS